MIPLLRRVLRDLGASRRLLGGVIACTLVYAAGRVVSPLLARSLLDATQYNRPAHVLGVTLPPATAVAVVPALILATALVLAAGQYLLRLWGALLGQRLSAELQVRLFERLLRFPADALERRGLGRQSVRFGSDMHAIRRLVSRTLPEFVRDAVAVIAIGATLVTLHKLLALPIVIVLAGFVAVSLLAWSRLQVASRALRAERSRVAGMAVDRLRTVSAVQLARAERGETGRLRRAQRRVVDAAARAAHLTGLLSAGAEVVVGAAVAVSLGVGIRQVMTGQVSAGEMVAVYGLALLLVSPLRSLSRAMEALAPGMVALERLYRVLERPGVQGEAEVGRVRVRRGEIVLRGVRTLRGAIPDVTIPPGVTVLTGESPRQIGRVLVRLDDLLAGHVTIDGVDLSRAGIHSLRRMIAYVPDPSVLIKGSLRRNLRIRGRAVTDEAMLSALHGVGALWVQALDQPVGTGGRRLSEVQRWQVLCARAVLVQAPIVILEHPPVAMDQLDAILKLLRERGARTIVLVSRGELLSPEITQMLRLDPEAAVHA